MGHFKVLGGITLLLSTLGVLSAPAAWADSTGLTESPSSTVGGDPIDKALDKANETSDDTTDKADQTTDGITDEVDEGTGGNQGDEVDGVVSETTRTIDENVDHVTGPTGPVRETKRLLLEAIGQGNDPAITRGGIDGFVNGPRSPGRDGARDNDSSGEALGSILGTHVFTASGEVNAATSPSSEAGGPSFAEQIERRIPELVRTLAFPLILAFLLGAFLLLQNRIDSHDPKMLLSVIDSEQNYLIFR